MSLALEPGRAQSASEDDEWSFILLWATSGNHRKEYPKGLTVPGQLPLRSHPSALHKFIFQGLGLKTQVPAQPKLTFLLFWIFLFFIFCFDSLGFLEVGRVFAPAFSLLIRVRELFLTGNSFVRGTDWEVMEHSSERADSLRKDCFSACFHKRH